MICLTIAPTSRKLAKVDLLNAAARADIVELCLDRLIKEPDVGDMLRGVDKPVIVSCRRPADGGHCELDDDRRIALLRQAIVAGPAYVELDPDTARKIPPFGDTKRIIGYVSKDRALGNVDTLYGKLVKECKADIVKLSWRTEYLEEAWSLLAAISRKRDRPVVGLGIGKASRMLQILGLRYGAHWVYGALEPEMAVHPNDATLFELEEVYDARSINPRTRFIGLVGFPEEAEGIAARVLNAGLRDHELPYRTLPIHLRRTDRCRDMFEKLKLNSLIVHPESGIKALGLSEVRDESARATQSADVVLKQPEGWTAYNVFGRIAARVLAETLPASTSGTTGLDRRNVLLVGAGATAQAIGFGISKRGGGLSIAAPEDAEARLLAQTLGARHVPFHTVYDTLADVVVFADPQLRVGSKRDEINPGFLRPTMTVMDVTCLPLASELLREAGERGCPTVDPAAVFRLQIAQQFRAITGRELPAEAFAPLED